MVSFSPAYKIRHLWKGLVTAHPALRPGGPLCSSNSKASPEAFAPHSSPAPLLLRGRRASAKKGRGGTARLMPHPFCTLSLLKDCGKKYWPKIPEE